MTIDRKMALRLARRPSRTLSNEVYEHLKQEIITCRLKPGQMIYESDLIRRYEVSKTPVREALKLLIQEGLVQAIPSIGYLVTPITLDDVRELLDMWRILEAAAIERAVERITEEELVELEKLPSEPRRLIDETTCLRWYEINTAFHVGLARAANNQRLARALSSVMEESLRLYFIELGSPTGSRLIKPSHAEIVAALRRRDKQTAISLSFKDIEVGWTTFLEFLDRSGRQGEFTSG